jgi:hypothetical protein
MQTYSLELLIDAEDLEAITSVDQRIILAKPVSDTYIPNVAWQSFDPQPENLVTWSEEYGIYASSTNLRHGSRILKTSSMPYPAQDAACYTFGTDANFHGPYQGPQAPGQSQYTVINEVPPAHYPALVFGLVQSAIINDKPANVRPLNAQLVAARQQTTFTPLTSVYVWLQSALESATVITQIPRRAAIITFSNSDNAQTLKYDPKHGTFIRYSPTKQGFILIERAVGMSPPLFI